MLDRHRVHEKREESVSYSDSAFLVILDGPLEHHLDHLDIVLGLEVVVSLMLEAEDEE